MNGAQQVAAGSEAPRVTDKPSSPPPGRSGVSLPPKLGWAADAAREVTAEAAVCGDLDDHTVNALANHFERLNRGTSHSSAERLHEHGVVVVHLNEDQRCALRELLGLVHYDDLAQSWRNLLPLELTQR